MAVRHCDADAAFAYLAQVSSTQHIKLREVARQIVADLSGD
jgi:AmiR/NasT family two-component response regulator